MQLLYNNSKVQKQCTDLKTAKKLFGGNAALATSLFARINACLLYTSILINNAGAGFLISSTGVIYSTGAWGV